MVKMSNEVAGERRRTVFIVGGDFAISQMFKKEGWLEIDNLLDADLVQFTGGADVSPHLYGEKNVGLSGCQPQRDAREFETFKNVLAMNIPMAGICRGAQFLNVMCGGKMFQDVTRHAIGGTHEITEVDSDRKIQVTSTHHQQMRPGVTAEIIATANLGGQKRRVLDGKIVTVDDPLDHEVLWYADRQVLCYQPHPEYGEKECKDYYFELLNRYFNL